MNQQQEALLQQLEAQVLHLTQQLNNVNFAIHSLRSGNQPPSRQHPTPIPALNPRCFGAVARPPNPYAGDYVAAPPALHPWERPRNYEFLGMSDPTMPHGFIKPDTTSHIFFYEQDCYVLSNFSAFTLQWENQDFDTSEAAYHWEKFPHLPDLQNAIRDARSAHAAYKIAEENRSRRRPDWDLVKVDIMKRILEAKVSQHAYVRRKLLETGNRWLVEDSWRDDFWGWGPERTGLNKLGQLWMEIRRELQLSNREHEKKPEAMTPSKLPVIVMATEDYVKACDDLVTKLSEYKGHMQHAADCEVVLHANIANSTCTCGLMSLLNSHHVLMALEARYSNIIGHKPGMRVTEPRTTEDQSANKQGGISSQGDTVTVPAEYFLALETATLSLIPNLHYQLVHHSNCAHLHRPSSACNCDRRRIFDAAKKAKQIRETLPLNP